MFTLHQHYLVTERKASNHIPLPDKHVPLSKMKKHLNRSGVLLLPDRHLTYLNQQKNFCSLRKIVWYESAGIPPTPLKNLSSDHYLSNPTRSQ